MFALLVYLLTLAPTITWQHGGADSADLAAAAFTLGIPHPPGYPLFTLIASSFAHLPFLEPAGGVALFTALCAALANLVLIRTSAAAIVPFKPNRLLALIPPLATLGLAFSAPVWSQSILAQVYSLNLLFVSAILWAMLVEERLKIMVVGAALALGMAHHLSILFLLPGIYLAMRPMGSKFWLPAVGVVPLLFYLSLAGRALTAPPLNWGNPVTPDRILWLISAAAYGGIPSDAGLDTWLTRGEYISSQFDAAFTLIGFPLALWGLIQWLRRDSRRAGALLVSFLLYFAYAVTLARRDLSMYLLPALAIMLLWVVYGAADIFRRVPQPLPLILLLAAAALPVYNLINNFEDMDLSRDRTAFDYAQTTFARVPHDAVIFAEGDEKAMALTYYRHAIARDRSSAVVVSQGLLEYDWYYDNLRLAMNEVSFAGPEVKLNGHQRAVEIANVTFAEGRAVCFATGPLLPEFDYEPNGNLSCVVSQK